MRVTCHNCHEEFEFDPRAYECSCGGAWEPIEEGKFYTDSIQRDEASVWRYREMIPAIDPENIVSLGAGWTPLLPSLWEGDEVFFKLEYLSPTGSFKDRGTEVEMSYLKSAGVQQVAEDSSGNAGAAAAAYAARAGIRAEIYVPESASAAKLAQIDVYGAGLHKIPGARIEATKAALKAVKGGAVYASHAYNPIYLLGQQSFAWEVWEQTGGKLPDALIIPVGQGGLLVGAWLGFRRLLLAGATEKMPRLYAVQPEALAPIHNAFSNNLEEVVEVEPRGSSIAKGLAITMPVRGKRILQALCESGGGTAAVTEDEISRAYIDLARKGFFVEPTSAVAAAAIRKVRKQMGESATILAALTGSGLKSPVLNLQK